MTLEERANKVITLAAESAAKAQATANAATLTNTLSTMQSAESNLVEMAELLVVLQDDAGQERAREGSEVARRCVADFVKRRPSDGHWQGVVLDNPDDVNELVRAVSDAAAHFQREAISSWQHVSERALRQGGGSIAALEALGGKFGRRAEKAKHAQDDLRQTLLQIGTRTPTPDQATSVLEKSEHATQAFEEALALIPDERIRDGLARAMSVEGLPLREAKSFLEWIESEGLEDSFSVRARLG